MRSTLLTLSLFLTFTAPRAAEYYYDFTPEAATAYASVMALELDRAQAEIDALRDADGRNLVSEHLESYVDFFRLYLSGDEGLEASLETRFERRLDRLAAGDPASPYHNYVLAEARLHRSLIHLRFEHHLAAFRELNRANKLLRRNARDFPEFLLTYKDLGLLHAAVGSIPPQYKWGVEFFSSLSGTIAAGREEIQLALTDVDSPFRLETQVLSALLELHLANAPETAYRYLNDLGLDAGSNPLHCFLLANIAMRSGRNDEAVRLLDARPRSASAEPFPYLDFMLGQARLRRLEPAARLYFQSFLIRYAGRHFREEALQKIGWTHLLEGNEEQYFAALDRINGRSRAGGDENASREAAREKPPHPGLLRARLLFDGNYGARARAQLNNTDPTTLNEQDQLEFLYRHGRVAEALGEYPAALAYYDQTIRSGAARPEFYACKAALQAGLIHERNGKNRAAAVSFRQCLTLQPAEYKTGLHLLAKAGLERVE